MRYVVDRLRGSFWFVPALCAAAGVALAVGLLFVDRRFETRLEQIAWFYGGGAEGARSLLSALASSVITVLGLAFSITIVALQLAAAQLGPRLLRNFVRDPGNQIVLGAFVGTFVYCLVVLRAVRGSNGPTDGGFVPQLSVTGAVVLGMLSVGVLIYFIHHAALSMQADHVIAGVAAELDDAIDTLFPEHLGREAETPAGEPAPEPEPREAIDVGSRGAGYVQSVAADRIFATAADHDLVVRLLCRPGDFVAEGDRVARAWPASRVTAEVQASLAGSIVLGTERTLLQDALFGVEQLVEIAINALSSSVREPVTAVRCVHRLGAAVGRLADRAMPSPLRHDAEGRLRVVAPVLAIEDFVRAAFGTIRAHAQPSAFVSTCLLETLTRLVTQQTRSRRALELALLEQALGVLRGSATLPDPLDREAVERAFHGFVHALGADARGGGDRPIPVAPAA
jgi:uncharacterized membrane protein